MPAAIPIVAAVVGAAATVYSADQSRKTQHQAVDQARAEANKPGPQVAKAATKTQANAANAAPGAPGALDPNSTLLSGAGGVATSGLNLGKNTLLGG